MAFVKLSKTQKAKMYREGGYREKRIMDNSTCVTTSKGYKGCVRFHDTKHKQTAIYQFGRGWIN